MRIQHARNRLLRSVTSTAVQPFLRAEVMISLTNSSATFSALCLGYDQHVDRAYEPAGPDRLVSGLARTAGYLTTRLGYHDARVRL